MMIESLKLDRSIAPTGQWAYFSGLPLWQGRDVFEFKPGLNVIAGPNGSGKSTLIRLMAWKLAALQGGISRVTESWVRETRGAGERANGSEFFLTHDGSAVLLVDPVQTVGLIGGQFDDDFMQEGLHSIFREKKASRGERTAGLLDRVLSLCMQEIRPERFYPPGESPVEQVHARFDNKKGQSNSAKFKAQLEKAKAQEAREGKQPSRSCPDDIQYAPGLGRQWLSAATLASLPGGSSIADQLKGTLPPGQKTFLLDEPELHLAPVVQHRVWKILSHPAVQAKYQLIVASHSIFALGQTANYLELKPGYCEASMAAFKECVADWEQSTSLKA